MMAGKFLCDGILKTPIVTVEKVKFSDKDPCKNSASKENFESDSKRCTSRKRTQSLNWILCPICGLSLRGCEQIYSHFQKEVNLLNEICCGPNLRKRVRYHALKRASLNHNDLDSNDFEAFGKDLQSRSAVFRQVQQHRYMRYADMYMFSSSVRLQRLVSGASNQPVFNDSACSYCLVSCPVCGTSVENTQSDGCQHISKCLAKKDGFAELFEGSDDEGDDAEFEEYTFAGQTRVRAVTLLEDNLAVLEGGTTRIQMVHCDDDLDVDGESDFGKAQYTESDVIPLSADEPGEDRVRKVIREALTVSCSPTGGTSNERWENSNVDRSSSAVDLPQGCEFDPVSARDSSLKLATHRGDDENFKCFICMSPYRSPLVSINCWHVCCEECWMRALGAKKVCPKCSTIVSSAQLRKIFL